MLSHERLEKIGRWGESCPWETTTRSISHLICLWELYFPLSPTWQPVQAALATEEMQMRLFPWAISRKLRWNKAETQSRARKHVTMSEFRKGLDGNDPVWDAFDKDGKVASNHIVLKYCHVIPNPASWFPSPGFFRWKSSTMIWKNSGCRPHCSGIGLKHGSLIQGF